MSAKDDKKKPEVPQKKKEHDNMPKPETKVVPGKPGDEKKAKKVVNAAVMYELKRELTDKDKLPPQCQEIVKILAAAPEKKCNRETLLSEMTKVVKTRQPIERILGYYQPRLISAGIIIMSQNVKEPAKASDAKSPSTPAPEPPESK